MDKNRGLMRCNEELGHHDAYVFAWGFLKSSPHAVVRSAVAEAVAAAYKEGYIVPEHMRRDVAWIARLGDDASPF